MFHLIPQGLRRYGVFSKPGVLILALVALFSLFALSVTGGGGLFREHSVSLASLFSSLRAQSDSSAFPGAPRLAARPGFLHFAKGSNRKEISLARLVIGDPEARIRLSSSASTSRASRLVAAKTSSADFWLGRFRPIFVKSVNLGAVTRRFISLRNGGLLFTDNEGKTFRRVLDIPRRYVPADYAGPVLFRDIEDLWVNPRRPLHILALNKHDILESMDGGLSFRKMRDSGVRGNLTRVSGTVDENGDLREIWLGTSVGGAYRVFIRRGKIRKKNYRHVFRGLPHLLHNSKNWLFEEISGIAIDQKRKLVFLTAFFRGGLFVARLPSSRRARVQFYRLAPPGLRPTDAVQSLYYEPGSSPRLVLGLERGLYTLSLAGADLGGLNGKGGTPRAPASAWSFTPAVRAFGARDKNSLFQGVFLPGRGRLSVSFRVPAANKGIPRNIRAIYISPTTARRKRGRAFRLIKKYRFNAAVIDVKDDFGRLIHGSSLPEARAMGNHRPRAPLRKLIAQLKKMNVYLIARMVVFKDSRVFRYRNNRYAIRDRYTGRPWIGNEIERWTDTYSTWVHQYNIRVAQEALRLGFDEIQFDYIRFPSDGPIGRCRWTHKKGDAYKSEALEAFLRRARASIKAPLSIDIYGYNGMYRVSGRVGQDLVDLGEYVDVISPMHYSSHYGPRYLEKVPFPKRTYTLLEMGSRRPIAMGFGRYEVRPWLQSFKLLTRRWGWGRKYMRDQIQGTLDGGGSGFLWWGPLKLFHLPGRVQKKMFPPAGASNP